MQIDIENAVFVEIIVFPGMASFPVEKGCPPVFPGNFTFQWALTNNSGKFPIPQICTAQTLTNSTGKLGKNTFRF